VRDAAGRAGRAGRGLALLLGLLMVTASCGTPSATIDNSVRVTDSTKAELTALLKTREDAIGRSDQKAFEGTYDMTRPAFRRWQAEEFAAAATLGPRLLGKIVDVQSYLDRYVRAWVEESYERPGWPKGLDLIRLYFRREAGNWLLTEPRMDELGGERTQTVAGQTLTYYGLDEDIAELFLDEARAARDLAAKLSPIPLRPEFNARLVPTAEIAGPGNTFAAGSHSDRSGLWLFPYAISLDPSRTRLASGTQSEYRLSSLDWMRDQVLPGIEARLAQASWLWQGWAKHQAWIGPRGIYQPACAGVPALTLKQLSDGPPEIGSPAATLEVFSQYYTYARTMGEYFDATFGLMAYWDLLKEFVPSVDAKANMLKVLHVTPDEFYANWLVWAKKKYC
jgi:hypothetical protein